MTSWTAFAAITGVVLIVLLVLSHFTQSAFDEIDLEDVTDDSSDADDTSVAERERDDAVERDAEGEPATTNTAPTAPEPAADRRGIDPDENVAPDATEPNRQRRPQTREDGIDPDALTTGAVLANVAVSQGLFALVLVGAVVYTGVPADALGIEFSRAYLETGLIVGTAVGIVLYLANEVGAALATRLGFDHDEQLRELLAPDTGRGWVALLGGVLPLIAVFEELLFRAALIGALSVGFGVSPWLLAVASSVAFALGHGMQGDVGVVVTGLLGFVLAAVFIVTGSFLVVVVAHYLINAFEFVVHEGIELEWARTLES
ncbi:CPBP family intramembrane glutamic endopeptidase [Natronococcus occultus]|uniref:Putative metal-dependent membrane protease n=1 Tax=Natronococcus occultus SP4 TaxID=694430 RepID=L0JXB7_9EURY|nr:CPBP family intramembrane glutamic endopeptidase [Natronococcus occultus]AGB36503.1 putative metal-dependent membrane protease [Natronococcus occultus SP4]